MEFRFRIWTLTVLPLLSCSFQTLDRAMYDYLPFETGSMWYYQGESGIEVWEFSGDTTIDGEHYRILLRNGYPHPFKIIKNNVYFLVEDTVIDDGDYLLYARELIPLWTSVFVDGVDWEYHWADSILVKDTMLYCSTSVRGSVTREGERYINRVSILRMRGEQVDILNYIYIFAPDTGVVSFEEGQVYSLYRYDH